MQKRDSRNGFDDANSQVTIDEHRPVLLGLEEEEEEEEADVSTPVPALTASEPSTTFNRDSVGESSELRKETEPELLPEKIEQHRDEGQVRLDVNRSFVSFPQGITPAEKEELRVVLERVIIAVLRRNRSLRYFQGYHDVSIPFPSCSIVETSCSDITPL